MNARSKALRLLMDLENPDVFIKDITTEKELRDFNDKDKNLIREIVYGVVRNRSYLDYIISKASKIKIKKIHIAILNILRLSIYQILFLDRIPESAIVNEAVKLAKNYGNKGSIGYVNGMLRNIAKNIDEFKEVKIKDPVKYLATRYSHPEFYIRELIETYGFDFTEELCNANNLEAELSIRVNMLLTTRENLKNELNSQGFNIIEGNLSPQALIVREPRGLMDTVSFKEGEFYIQDQSSMLVCEYLNPQEGGKILDLCAAPGGKTTYLSQLTEDKSSVFARDKTKDKLSIIEENAKRLKILNIHTELKDANTNYPEDTEGYDYVLLDAPCSGFGLIRKKPEIRWNKTSEDVKNLSKIQQNMIKIAGNYVKPGGKLLYSTCTLTKEENEVVISAFLKNNKQFSIEQIKEKNVYKLFPNVDNSDGFSMTLLKKEDDFE